jgi:hypothetical protein
MKKVVNKNIFGVVSLLTFMGFCMTLTKPIQSESTLNESRSAQPGVTFMTVSEGGWTWTDFGGQAIGWAAAGAASGAIAGGVAGSAAGGICAGPGALAGAGLGTLTGAVGGMAYYAGTQAWSSVFGGSRSSSVEDPFLPLSLSDASLD